MTKSLSPRARGPRNPSQSKEAFRDFPPSHARPPPRPSRRAVHLAPHVALMSPNGSLISLARLSALPVLLMLNGCASGQLGEASPQSTIRLFDKARGRPIPVELYLPSNAFSCSAAHPCPTAIISPGYGISPKSYSFIASALSTLGYLVMSVQQELPSDPPLVTEGDLFAGRTPNWQRGAANLRFAIQFMRGTRPEFNLEHPVLIGHSNGGDIAAWLVRESPGLAAALVTLDNRRVPLPRAASPRVLSVRAADFPADVGVLPNAEERRKFGSCIFTIGGARHDDMYDGGPVELRQAIVRAIVEFLSLGECAEEAPAFPSLPRPGTRSVLSGPVPG